RAAIRHRALDHPARRRNVGARAPTLSPALDVLRGRLAAFRASLLRSRAVALAPRVGARLVGVARPVLADLRRSAVGARRTLNLGVRSAAPGFRRLRARGLTRDLRTGRAVWGRRRGRSRARPAALRRLRRTVGDDRAAAAAILPADRIGPRGLEAA